MFLKRLSIVLLAMTFIATPALRSGLGIASAAAVAAEGNVYKGKVLGVSKKAKTITIEVKKSPMMVKFDDNTKGMEHATKGHAAIIQFEMRGKDKVATVIKPKLAKLPEGVTEIKTEELAKLITDGPEKANYFLVDSRPGKRYDEGHIPTAKSIPVPELEKSASAHLPDDIKRKNTLLIFYCGGPT